MKETIFSFPAELIQTIKDQIKLPHRIHRNAAKEFERKLYNLRLQLYIIHTGWHSGNEIKQCAALLQLVDLNPDIFYDYVAPLEALKNELKNYTNMEIEALVWDLMRLYGWLNTHHLEIHNHIEKSAIIPKLHEINSQRVKREQQCSKNTMQAAKFNRQAQAYRNYCKVHGKLPLHQVLNANIPPTHFFFRLDMKRARKTGKEKTVKRSGRASTLPKHSSIFCRDLSPDWQEKVARFPKAKPLEIAPSKKISVVTHRLRSTKR